MLVGTRAEGLEVESQAEEPGLTGVQFVLSVMMDQLSECYKSLTLEAEATHKKVMTPPGPSQCWGSN